MNLMNLTKVSCIVPEIFVSGLISANQLFIYSPEQFSIQKRAESRILSTEEKYNHGDFEDFKT